MPKIYITYHLCDQCVTLVLNSALYGFIKVGCWDYYCSHRLIEKCDIVPSDSDEEEDIR